MWSVLQPVVLLATYGWVFIAVLKVGGDDLPYLSFAWAGLVAYSFVQQCLSGGVGVLLDSSYIVSKVYFPREILPLVVVGVAAVDLAITFVILVALSWVQIGPPTVHLLGAVAALGVLVVLMAAVTITSSAAAVYLRDIRHAMPLFLRVAFIVSPVMYSVDLIASKGGWLVTLNPLTILMEAVRDGALRHQWPSPAGLGGCALVAVVWFIGATAFVRRAERRMSDVL